jgi:sulfur carrier protein
MNCSIDPSNGYPMKIILNGQIKEFPSAPNLEDVIGQFCKDKNPVIAELNGAIIKDPQWKSTAVKEGDIIELVSFVGGGSFVACGL